MERIISKAPFRISFCGGGTDLPEYFNRKSGVVLSTTIDKYITVTLEPRDDNSIIIDDKNYGILKTYAVGDPMDKEFKLVEAVVKYYGFNTGFNLDINSDIRAGSGLGGSSSLTVALLNAFATAQARNPSKETLAKDAIKIERDILNISGGWQDQYAAAFGGFNLIHFSKEKVIPMTIHLPARTKIQLQSWLALYKTGITRESGDILADQKSNYSNKDVEERLDKMVDMTFEMIDSITHHNFSNVGAIMHRAWQEKKKLSKSISNPVIDDLYETATWNPPYKADGGKLLGAGGGGYLLFVIAPSDGSAAIRDRLESKGAEYTYFEFEEKGAHVEVL